MYSATCGAAVFAHQLKHVIRSDDADITRAYIGYSWLDYILSSHARAFALRWCATIAHICLISIVNNRQNYGAAFCALLSAKLCDRTMSMPIVCLMHMVCNQHPCRVYVSTTYVYNDVRYLVRMSMTSTFAVRTSFVCYLMSAVYMYTRDP